MGAPTTLTYLEPYVLSQTMSDNVRQFLSRTSQSTLPHTVSYDPSGEEVRAFFHLTFLPTCPLVR